jgi:hypothetical protein
MMKPVLANLVGQIGSGFELLAFEGRTADGKRIVDPVSEQRFSIQVGAHAFDWRLPLGSLLPPMHDPMTGEVFPGNYRFSPYTGTALKPKAP